MRRLGPFKYYRRPISKGSHGTIYKGYYRTKKRPIAIKKIRNARKAWTEYRALRRVGRHRSTVRCYAFYKRNRHYYIVIGWSRGKPLGIRHRRRWIGKKRSVKTACLITIRLLQTMSYMHKKHMSYNDINPSNVMIWTRKRYVKLVYFGNVTFTRNKRVHRKDVARCAYLLAFMLVGNVRRYSRRFPRLRVRRAPRSLKRIIRKATHPREKMRYRSAASLIKALKRYV